MASQANSASNKRRRCPACKELALVPILYGVLPQSLADEQARGELFWGGTVRNAGSPRWKCSSCDGRFPDDAV